MLVRVGALLVGLVLPWQIAAAQTSVSDAEILVDLPALGSDASDELDGLARFRLAMTVGDRFAAEAALTDPTVPAWVATWLTGRLELADGTADRAASSLQRASRLYREDPHAGAEDSAILAALDRDHLRAAVAAGDAEAVAEVIGDPLTSHQDDPRWRAWVALADPMADPETTLLELDRAWEAATRTERAAAAFVERARLRLTRPEPSGAAAAWLAYVKGLRRPADHRHALRVWDETPALHEAVRTDGHRVDAVRWLGRLVRRDEAYEIALDGVAHSTGAEAATCFVLAAEQLYRLRRHDELARHLDQAWPPELTAEQRAALEAYPWGVRRRQGERITAAKGFDEVVERHGGTRRAVEALWESAWMWELAGESETAASRFETYAVDHSDGPFAAAAAARAIFLPLQRGDVDVALQTYRRVESTLGRGMDQACAQWLRARALVAAGRDATTALAELSDEHPFNPLQYPPPHPLGAATEMRVRDREVLLGRLAEVQRAAFDRVGQELGVTTLVTADRRLHRAARFLELGLFREGEAILARVAAQNRRDPVVQFHTTAIAWRYGRAERQARSGYQLRLLLRDRTPELDRSLDVVSHPIPFAREVLRVAQNAGVPAGLVWALMRRESFYEADVTSIAGAHGLMQLMPPTAGRMAEKLGDVEPTIDDLHRPRTNLTYGTTYLQQLLQESEGDLYRALASYNAGEANGLRWANRRGEDQPPQEMILLISYSETRGYVYNLLRTWRLISAAYLPLGIADGLQP